jgi:PIN domain nuclease of toxin-antitoxin system
VQLKRASLENDEISPNHIEHDLKIGLVHFKPFDPSTALRANGSSTALVWMTAVLKEKPFWLLFRPLLG